jgi:hypothetical protein
MIFSSLEARRNCDRMPYLTIREAQVLQLLAEGCTMKEIADQLNSPWLKSAPLLKSFDAENVSS